jgi:hypothetical protein
MVQNMPDAAGLHMTVEELVAKMVRIERQAFHFQKS